jgi:hypothetical protein
MKLKHSQRALKITNPKFRKKNKPNHRVAVQKAIEGIMAVIERVVEDEAIDSQWQSEVPSLKPWHELLRENLERWIKQLGTMIEPKQSSFIQDKLEAATDLAFALEFSQNFLDAHSAQVFVRFSNLEQAAMDKQTEVVPTKKLDEIFRTLEMEFGMDEQEVDGNHMRIYDMLRLTLRLQLPFQSLCPFRLSQCWDFDEHRKELESDLKESELADSKEKIVQI